MLFDKDGNSSTPSKSPPPFHSDNQKKTPNTADESQIGLWASMLMLKGKKHSEQ